MPGVVTFAAVMFSLAGFFHGIQGLGAIFKKEYFAEGGLLYENLQVTGWIWLIVGVLQLVAAYLLFGQASSGRVLALVMAWLSAIVSFFSIGAFPVWSLVVIAVDVLIIYGLTVHADAFVPGGVVEGGTGAVPPEPAGRPFA